MTLGQKKLVAVHDLELKQSSVPFYFRLEVHENNEAYSGTIYRVDRYTFDPVKDVAGMRTLPGNDGTLNAEAVVVAGPEFRGTSEVDVIFKTIETLQHIYMN